MCGIFVYYNCKPVNFDPDVILELLAHRGPDVNGVSKICGAHLLHTCLAIQDEPAFSRQPMSTADEAVHITYNGEIYNFIELRDILLECGRVFKTTTDTEVLLEGYLEWGIEKLIKKLRGMYAFVLVDSSKNLLYAARDPFGMKPLYYNEENEHIVFSSEIKPILNVKETGPFEVNNQKLLLNLFYGRDYQDNQTLFSGVKCLEPGQLITYEFNSMRIKTKKSISDVKDWIDKNEYKALLHTPAFQLDKRLLDSIRRSVEEHLISHADVGVLCSGGLDSSIIATIAAELRPDTKLFYLKSDKDLEGLQAVRKLAKLNNANLIEVSEKSNLSLKALPQLIKGMEIPALKSDLFVRSICSEAKRLGLKVLLSGDCADELFGGYEIYAWLYSNGSAISPDASVDNLIFSSHSSTSKLKDLLDFTLFGGKRADKWQEAQNAYNHCVSNEERTTQAYLLDNLTGNMIGKFLHRADMAGMQSGIEIRVPFLSEYLVKFALNLPLDQKLNQKEGSGYQQKIILKRIAEDLGVPDSIIHRRKVGLVNTVGLQAVKICEHWDFVGIKSIYGFDRSIIKAFLHRNPSNAWSFLNVDIWICLFQLGSCTQQIVQKIAKVEAQLASSSLS